jgi:transcriptional regulator with XRE-family HTH domain
METNDLLKIIGQNVSKLRMDKGISKEDFAKAIGVDITGMEKIEAGIGPLQVSTLFAMARELKVKDYELMGSSEPALPMAEMDGTIYDMMTFARVPLRKLEDL